MDFYIKGKQLMKFKEMLKSIWFQIKKENAFKNIFITHNAWGIFSINSHVNQHTGVEKIKYPTVKSAEKSAKAMSEKKGVHFSIYKCAFCDGYHIGRNRDNKGD